LDKNSLFEFEGGEVQIWIEQESIHMFACDKSFNDPVELTADTARRLAQKLVELADLIDHSAGALVNIYEVLRQANGSCAPFIALSAMSGRASNSHTHCSSRISLT